MADNIIDVPHLFVALFCDYARARQIADAHFDTDVIDQPLDISAGRTRISLSNGYPGCSPFLQLIDRDGAYHVQVGAHYSTARVNNVLERIEGRDVISGERAVDMNYPFAAAITAYDLWVANS
jgi:hypothetical protein